MSPTPAHRMRLLFVDGRPVTRVEIATSPIARARGLLGRDAISGALLLESTGSVHTFAMRFAIDVALCTQDLEVIAVRQLPPGRLIRPRRRVRTVVEAEAGAFARWGLVAGARLTVSDEEPAAPRSELRVGPARPGPR